MQEMRSLKHLAIELSISIRIDVKFASCIVIATKVRSWDISIRISCPFEWKKISSPSLYLRFQ